MICFKLTAYINCNLYTLCKDAQMDYRITGHLEKDIHHLLYELLINMLMTSKEFL